MALDTILKGGSNTAGTANVDTAFNVQVNTPGYNSLGVMQGGGDVNGPCSFSEVDSGKFTGAREVLSAEVDQDYRQRVSHDNLLDQECFNYTAQNTNKHSHTFTTLTATVSAAGLLTNSGGITTTATGMTFGTFAMFPVGGTQIIAVETVVAFTAQPNVNTVIDFGLFQRAAATPFAPTDGAYFRLTSTGLIGVVLRNGGAEVTTSVFPLSLGTGIWLYTNNQMNKYLIQMTNVSTTFWINNYLMGEIMNPTGAGFPCASSALPWSIRHSIGAGAAGAVTQALVSDYRVISRGVAYPDRLGVAGNRVFGSYRGLSGNAMGSLATLPNSTLPTAGVPVNTSLAANLPAGLGGQGLVTAAVAAATDGIWGSFQVPVGTALVAGRRLVLRGLSVDLLNLGAAVAITATTLQFALAFGHTAVSLATAETGSFVTATAKAPTKVSVGFATWAVGAGIGSQPQTGKLVLDLGDAPTYVNPGEFIALLAKFIVGTATASQTIQFVWQPVFGWE